MNKETLSNSGSIIFDLFKWRKPLVLFSFLAVILAGLFSSSLIITPKFKSTSIIYPTTTNSISQALLNFLRCLLIIFLLVRKVHKDSSIDLQ